MQWPHQQCGAQQRVFDANLCSMLSKQFTSWCGMKVEAVLRDVVGMSHLQHGLEAGPPAG